MGIMTKILSSMDFQISYSMSLRHSLCLSLNVFFYPGLCSLQTSKILLVFEIASYFKLTWSQALRSVVTREKDCTRHAPCLASLWKAWQLHGPMGNLSPHTGEGQLQQQGHTGSLLQSLCAANRVNVSFLDQLVQWQGFPPVQDCHLNDFVTPLQCHGFWWLSPCFSSFPHVIRKL